MPFVSPNGKGWTLKIAVLNARAEQRLSVLGPPAEPSQFRAGKNPGVFGLTRADIPACSWSTA
jgi:hypothetical protein